MTRADPERVCSLLRRLVAVDSINPSISPDGRGEEAIARLIADECHAAGLRARLDEVAPHRPNVVVHISGRRPGRRLMVNGHMDTVSVAGMRDPFGGRIDGTRLYSRGAYDMKGSLAAMIEAGRLVAEQGLPAGELVLAFVIDEEYESLGTTDLLRREHADAAIVTEPTGLDLCLAHRGFIWARIETAGRAAHGSRYAEGDDAIIKMAALDRLEPRYVGELPWFDAALLGAAGIPTAMFGPAGAGAHAAEEWVDLPSVVICAEVLADVAVRYSGLA